MIDLIMYVQVLVLSVATDNMFSNYL